MYRFRLKRDKNQHEIKITIKKHGWISEWAGIFFRKTRQVFPYWLCAALVISGLQVTAVLFLQKPLLTYSEAATAVDGPKVLGASISLRGSDNLPQSPKLPAKKAETNFSEITAKSFLVYDVSTGAVLAEKNSGSRLPIASLTKLVTAMVAYDGTDLNKLYTVTNSDELNTSPVLNLKPGDQIKGWDLFNAMLVGSANDSALALSHFVADASGQDFIALMNKKAKELGMSDSQFSNPLGFDSKNNYSTAADLKKIVERTQSLAAFTNLGKKTSYSFTSQAGNSYKVAATNKLVGTDPGIEAIKTGFTESSDGSMITKITRGGHKIVLIVLGSLNREKDTLKISDEVFKAFEW